MRSIYGLLFTLLAAGACTSRMASEAGMPGASDLSLRAVVDLEEARDYFTLRNRLAAANPTTLAARYADALVAHAFNAPARSAMAIEVLLADGDLPDSLVQALRMMQLRNHVRTFSYAEGARVADHLLAAPDVLAEEDQEDVHNMRRLFMALSEVPPQTVILHEDTQLHFVNGRLPVVIGDSIRHYVFDTGANLSTIMRSEAEALGLSMREAGIDVGTATDQRVQADLAVAEQVRLGEMEFRNVIFLVLDDELLTFPGGMRIPGIIGFPVIEQMGEVQIGTEGTLFVARQPPARGRRNLALHELTPLVHVGWNGRDLLCRFDTGADFTMVYERVYQAQRHYIDSLGIETTAQFGGAGGVRSFPARVLVNAELTVGDTTVVLDSLDVLTQSIARTESDDYLDCNLGRDVLEPFSAYILNFRDMSFLLR